MVKWGMTVREKFQYNDGKVYWEAYDAQFKLLLVRNGWDDKKNAAHLTNHLAQTDRSAICS